MRKIVDKIKSWLGTSNRGRHLAGGMAMGFFACGWWTAAYAGIGVASALELKDKLWGGRWDWVDWCCTVAGVAMGAALGYGVGFRN